MIKAKEVEALNTRIEKLNTERTKAKTRQELLTDRLNGELKEYKEAFGVDLVGKTLSETKKKIDAEVQEVTTVVEDEYNLKLKIVEAIESGDFDTAKKLLGIQEESVEDEFSMESEEDENQNSDDSNLEEENIAEGNESNEDGLDFFGDDVFEEDLEDDSSDEMSATEEQDEVSAPSNFLKAVENASKGDEKPKAKAPVMIDDEEDEVELPASKSKKETKEVKGKSVSEAFAGLAVEDDEDIDDDFGFGDMLSGTKFE